MPGCGELWDGRARTPDVGDFLLGVGAGSPNIRIGDVGNFSTYREDAGRISPPSDTWTTEE